VCVLAAISGLAFFPLLRLYKQVFMKATDEMKGANEVLGMVLAG
jgi:hypothetical protein